MNHKFKTIAEVAQAAADGVVVYWKNDAYTVTGKESPLVVCSLNSHCVGLFHANGVDSEYSPEDFYTK